MSIKPVDFQVMIPKSSEVSKIPNAEQHRSQALTQQQAGLVQQKADNSLRQVYHQDKAYEAQIRERQEKQQKKKDGSKEEKKDNKQPTVPASGSKPERQSVIDIKI